MLFEAVRKLRQELNYLIAWETEALTRNSLRCSTNLYSFQLQCHRRCAACTSQCLHAVWRANRAQSTRTAGRTNPPRTLDGVGVTTATCC